MQLKDECVIFNNYLYAFRGYFLFMIGFVYSKEYDPLKQTYLSLQGGLFKGKKTKQRTKQIIQEACRYGKKWKVP